MSTRVAIGAKTPLDSVSDATGLAILSSWNGVAACFNGLASFPASLTYLSTHGGLKKPRLNLHIPKNVIVFFSYYRFCGFGVLYLLLYCF